MIRFFFQKVYFGSGVEMIYVEEDIGGSDVVQGVIVVF